MQLCIEDIESLTKQLPDMSSFLVVPDLKFITNFFNPRNFLQNINDESKDKDSSMRIDCSLKDNIRPQSIDK